MPKAKTKPDVRLTDMKEKAVQRIAELWDLHIEKAMGILDESESRVVRLNFAVELDFAESTAKETTHIRYTQAFTDKRQDDFESGQGTLVGRAPDGSEIARIEPPKVEGETGTEETGTGEQTPAGSDDAAAAIARAKNRSHKRKK